MFVWAVNGWDTILGTHITHRNSSSHTWVLWQKHVVPSLLELKLSRSCITSIGWQINIRNVDHALISFQKQHKYFSNILKLIGMQSLQSVNADFHWVIGRFLCFHESATLKVFVSFSVSFVSRLKLVVIDTTNSNYNNYWRIRWKWPNDCPSQKQMNNCL